MKKFIIFIMILFLVFSNHNYLLTTFAMEENLTNEKIYAIVDENGDFLVESQNVKVGDKFINKLFEEFEIVFVDEENLFAVATFSKLIDKPKITKKQITNISNKTYNKNIGLYCTHNDESYEIGDGISSVYGKGGIHDISKQLAVQLSNLGVNVIFDETLHIPHDTKAYSRSNTTAKNLICDYNVDALFDIHRDGASRRLYVTKDNNQEKCMVRIVVGQANENKEKNLEFAKYLMSVSEVICPWLFLDIYYASGHYNQALTEKGLLFEMGSHLVEKNLVSQTVPYLADVIYTALYNTTINEEENLTIGNQTSEDPTLDEYFKNDIDFVDTSVENANEDNFKIIAVLVIITLTILFVLVFMLKGRKIKE